VSTEDPEAARIVELLERASEGSVTEAETEELALYARDDPALLARIEKAVKDRDLGEGWLVRVRKDDQIARTEQGSRARSERMAGLALVAGGFGLQFFTVFGAALMGIGALVLLYSIIRVRLATHRDDPYKDVNR
jgi:hypothetical protein